MYASATLPVAHILECTLRSRLSTFELDVLSETAAAGTGCKKLQPAGVAPMIRFTEPGRFAGMWET